MKIIFTNKDTGNKQIYFGSQVKALYTREYVFFGIVYQAYSIITNDGYTNTYLMKGFELEILVD